jgi:hypothetical protein
MTLPEPDNERDRARHELRLAGPYTLEMIRGEVSVDAFIALSALSAAGKLQDFTARPDEALWHDLRAAAATWPDAPALVASIDLPSAAVDLHEADEADDPDLRFRRLLALAAVLECVGSQAAPSAWRFVQDQLAALDQGPADWLELGPAAGEIRSALLLPDGHLVDEVLRTLETAWEETMVEHILTRRLPAWLSWAQAVAPERADALQKAANSPFLLRMVAASAHDARVVPGHELLAARGPHEVYLVLTQPPRVEWLGGGAPGEATFDGVPLRRLPDPIAGEAAWELPDRMGIAGVLAFDTDPPWEIRA